MKKWICFSVALFIGCFSVQREALAAPYELKWKENNLCISVDHTDFKGMYSVDYLNPNSGDYECVYDETICNSVYLLMMNGGFFPNPDILLKENGTIYISTKDLDLVGIKMIIDDVEETISLYYGSSVLTFERNSDLVAINEKFYVPMRLVVEKFGGEIEYIHDYKKTICNKDQGNEFGINMISVEMIDEQQNLKSYTPQEGLEKVKKMSLIEYEQIISLLEERNQTFTKDSQNYDPLSVYYTGENFGRYYIYKLEGFEKFPVFFNKYTGEIYGENPWSPIMTIECCFPDLSKIY